MAENLVDSSQIKENDQLTVDEWKSDLNGVPSNDKNEQDIVEKLNDTSINENANSEKQDSSCNLIGNENVQNEFNASESKNQNDNKNSGYKKGRGNYNKSNSNHTRGRGRGRGINKKFNNGNESEKNGYNHSTNTTSGSRGRGRGHHRGRGGKFNEKSSDGWYGNNEDGSKIKENNKLTGPKTEYIPPDIENDETIAGIEAGLNFDKYKTIEVKVNGTNPPKCMTSFQTSNLCNILQENLSICNFTIPTPIQNYAIPIVMAGRDLMASAQTGSGKTVCQFIFNF